MAMSMMGHGGQCELFSSSTLRKSSRARTRTKVIRFGQQQLRSMSHRPQYAKLSATQPPAGSSDKFHHPS